MCLYIADLALYRGFKVSLGTVGGIEAVQLTLIILKRRALYKDSVRTTVLTHNVP